MRAATAEPHFEYYDYGHLFCLCVTGADYARRGRQWRRQEAQGFVFSGNTEVARIDEVVAELQRIYQEVKVLPRAYEIRHPGMRAVYIRDPRIPVEAVAAEAANKTHVPSPPCD